MENENQEGETTGSLLQPSDCVAFVVWGRVGGRYVSQGIYMYVCKVCMAVSKYRNIHVFDAAREGRIRACQRSIHAEVR